MFVVAVFDDEKADNLKLSFFFFLFSKQSLMLVH